MPAQKPTPITGLTRTGKIVMVGLSVAAVAAMLLATRGSSESANVAVQAQPQRAAAVDLTDTKTTAPAAKRAPAARPRATQPATSKPAAVTRSATAPVADSRSADTRVAVAAVADAAEPVSNAVLQESTPVTITGCLEDEDGTFRLKETSGEDVPKSRSWKSGFLRKSSASIWVVDAANNRLRLPTHVGQRVSLTGVIADREMQARSLQRVAGESCD